MATLTPLLSAVPVPDSPFERRLRGEWSLLRQLARLNPERLTDLQVVDAGDAGDTSLWVTLRGTPALSLHGDAIASAHRLRIDFPRYFPAVPLELFLEQPVRHPNVHPETGFVCLWDQHRVDHTAEHALHKTAAILGWRLLNRDARHVMQPAAMDHAPGWEARREALVARLQAPALLGIAHAPTSFELAGGPRRKRLS